MNGSGDDVYTHLHRIKMVLAWVLAKYSLTLSAYLYTWKCTLPEGVRRAVFSPSKDNNENSVIKGESILRLV